MQDTFICDGANDLTCTWIRLTVLWQPIYGWDKLSNLIGHKAGICFSTPTKPDCSLCSAHLLHTSRRSLARTPSPFSPSAAVIAAPIQFNPSATEKKDAANQGKKPPVLYDASTQTAESLGCPAKKELVWGVKSLNVRDRNYTYSCGSTYSISLGECKKKELHCIVLNVSRLREDATGIGTSSNNEWRIFLGSRYGLLTTVKNRIHQTQFAASCKIIQRCNYSAAAVVTAHPLIRGRRHRRRSGAIAKIRFSVLLLLLLFSPSFSSSLCVAPIVIILSILCSLNLIMGGAHMMRIFSCGEADNSSREMWVLLISHLWFQAQGNHNNHLKSDFVTALSGNALQQDVRSWIQRRTSRGLHACVTWLIGLALHY